MYDPSTLTGRTATQQAILAATEPLKKDITFLSTNTYRKSQTYTKQEVDDLIVDSQAGVLPLNVISTTVRNTGNVDMNSKKIIALLPGTQENDAVNLSQLQNAISQPKDRIISQQSPESNFAEITAQGGFQLVTSSLQALQVTGIGSTFSLPAKYNAVGVEDAEDLGFASHKYVDDMIKIEHDDRVAEDARIDSRIDNKANTADVYTKSYIDSTFWTRTESNSKYYSSLNPSNYQTLGEVNQVSAQDRGYTDVAVQNLADESMLLSNDGISAEFFNARSKEIKNLLAATESTSAVNLSQLNNALDDKVDKTTPINMITQANASLNMNNQKISGLAPATLPTDAVRFDQIGSTAQFATKEELKEEAKTRQDADVSLATLIATKLDNQTTLNNIVVPNGNLNMNNYRIQNLAIATGLLDAVNLGQLNGTAATLQSNITTESEARIAADQQLQTDIQAKANANDVYSKIESDAKYSTKEELKNENSARIAYQQSNDNAIAYIEEQYRMKSDHDSILSSSDANSKLECLSGNNGIRITSSGNQIGSIRQQIGQAQLAPLQISAVDRLVLVNGNGSTSMGTSATSNGIYISSNDNSTSNCQDQLVIGSGSNRQGLTLSCGHADAGAGQQPYSVICNSGTSSLPNLQIGPGINTLADSALYMYGDSVASLFPIQNQFTRRVGRNSTQTSPLANEFITKSYADATYSGGGGQANQITQDVNTVVCGTGSLGGITLKNTSASAATGSLNTYLISQLGTSNTLAMSTPNTTTTLQISGADTFIKQSNTLGQLIFQPQGSSSGCQLFLKATNKASSDGTSAVVISGSHVQSQLAQDTTITANTLIRRDYAEGQFYTKTLSDSRYIPQTGGSYAQLSRPNQTTALALTDYVTANDLVSSNRIGLLVDSSNLLLTTSLAMPAGQSWRTPTNPSLDNDCVRFGFFKQPLNYFAGFPLTDNFTLGITPDKYTMTCRIPTGLYEVANKTYVDTAVSTATVGSIIAVYRIQKSDGTGFTTSSPDGTQLSVVKLTGGADFWFSNTALFNRGTNNMGLVMSTAVGFTLSQFDIQAKFRTSVPAALPVAGYFSDNLTTTSSFMTYPTTTTTGRSFTLQWYNFNGTSTTPAYIDLNVYKVA